VQPALDALDGVDGDVVVVGHSLAGAYAPLLAAARPVALLVYLCPAPAGPLVGIDAPMRSTRPDFPWPPEDERGLSRWDPDSAIATIYPRLSPETARATADHLKPGGAPSDSYPLDEVPDVPAVLIYTTHDEFFEPAWEEYAARAVAARPIEIGLGHFPMLEDPEALADLLTGSLPPSAPA